MSRAPSSRAPCLRFGRFRSETDWASCCSLKNRAMAIQGGTVILRHRVSWGSVNMKSEG